MVGPFSSRRRAMRPRTAAGEKTCSRMRSGATQRSRGARSAWRRSLVGGSSRYTSTIVKSLVVFFGSAVSSCRVSRLLFARRSARSEPSSHSAYRDGRRPRGAGAGAGAGACDSSGRAVFAAAVEQGGELATSRCAVVFNDTTADGKARADANAESVEEADR